MIKYFIHILKHKYYVFIECWKMGLYLHAFTHDLSKFLPDEFFPYANWFYGKYGKDYYEKWANYEYGYDETIDYSRNAKKAFEKAWVKHQNRNKHHPGHKKWKIRLDVYDMTKRNWHNIPIKYIKQMACDLRAMSKQFKNDPIKWYIKNKPDFALKLSEKSLIALEKILVHGKNK
jgi:hypothetical protein